MGLNNSLIVIVLLVRSIGDLEARVCIATLALAFPRNGSGLTELLFRRRRWGRRDWCRIAFRLSAWR